MCLAAGLCPDPLGELSAPHTPSHEQGRGGIKGGERKGRGRKGVEGREQQEDVTPKCCKQIDAAALNLSII